MYMGCCICLTAHKQKHIVKPLKPQGKSILIKLCIKDNVTILAQISGIYFSKAAYSFPIVCLILCVEHCCFNNAESTKLPGGVSTHFKKMYPNVHAVFL